MKFSIEAEQSVIGGLMLDPGKLDDVLEILQAEDFYRADNRSIMKYIMQVSGTGQTADPVTVAEAMHGDGMLEPAGGLGYLVEIANNTPSAANVKAYAYIVADRAIERRITEAGQRIAEIGDDESHDVDAKLDSLHMEMAKLERREKEAEVISLEKSLKACLEILDQKNRGVFPEGIKTGFNAFDDRIGWLNPGDLWIVAGRPGQGKTNWGLNVCDNVSSQAKGDVLIFNCEMTSNQLTGRMMVAKSGIDNKLFRMGKLEEEHWPMLSAAVLKLKKMRIEICDTPSIDIAKLKAIARTRARRGKISLIMVDYLQLVTDRKYQKTIDIVSSVSRQLKEIAKLCNCPVLALAQLNRGVEQRANKRPSMADLRDSGQIEQDADIISFLYRDEYYNENTPNKGMAELITAKLREGETGTDIVGTQFQFCRFTNFDASSYIFDWQEKGDSSYSGKPNKFD